MIKTAAKTATLAASALSLFACAIEESPSQSPNGGSREVSWSINPADDLNSFFDCLETENITLLSAHRGGPYPGFPENAVQTMSAILKKAPAIFEVDVATSADGVLYLMHDDTLDRTTTGSGRANEKDWHDIASLNLVDNNGTTTTFAPSTLEEALLLIKDHAILQIDFKQSTRYEDVINAVKRQGVENRVIYIAYSLASAQKLHRLAPSAMISLSINSQSELNRAVAAGIPATRLLGFTGTEDPRARLFRLLNDQDIEVIFGTLGGRNSLDRDIARYGNDELYYEIASLGVDILATDRPIEANEALARDNRAAKSGVCGITNS